jgi:hypothetical protein
MLNTRALNAMSDKLKWITIQEAIAIANNIKDTNLTDSDIYRHALYGNIRLSIYFQSPIIVRKIQTSTVKIKLHPLNSSLIDQFCILEKNCFLNERNLIFSTEGRYIYPAQRIIDTPLIGYEYVLVQRLLAISLGIAPPVISENHTNYGVTVSLGGHFFQVFEKVTWQERVNQQIMRLPENAISCISEQLPQLPTNKACHKEYFPVYDLPRDACFVIRYAELEKLINIPVKSDSPRLASTRVSTPLSRLFWLACKNNDVISPLIKQPYKLLSIFEQWASDEGITDKLSGDTLKTALERGSPTSISAKN